MPKNLRARRARSTLSRVLAVWLAGWVFADGSRGETPLETPESQLAELVEELGAPSWESRERAQERLIEQGVVVVPALKRALESDNLEQNYRARYLLDRIDPELAVFQVLKVDVTGPDPELISFGEARAHTDEEATVEPAAVDGAPGERVPFVYTVKVQPGADGSRRVTASRSRSDRPSPLRFSFEFVGAQTTRLLVRTEETYYRTLGLHVDRERRRYLTLVRIHHGRTSDQTGGATIGAPTLEDLLDSVREQALARTIAERSAALDILASLARGRNETAFEFALRHPDLRSAAALGLDRMDLLAEAAAAAPETDDSDLSLDDRSRRALVRLVELGDDAAYRRLLYQLRHSPLDAIHEVAAAVADRTRRGLTPELADATLETIFSADFFARAIWEDREIQYLLAVALKASDRDRHGPVLERGLELTNRLLRGQLAGRRILLDEGLDLWRRIALAQSDTPPPLRPVLLGLLGALFGDIPDYRLSNRVESELRAGPLSESEFETFLRQTERVGERPSSYPAFLRVVGSLRIADGQLAPLLERLLALGRRAEADSSLLASHRDGYLSQIRRRLALFSGVGSSTSPWTDWEKWLAISENVRAREAELRSSSESGGSGPGDRFVFYEFVLQLEASEDTTRGVRKPPRPAVVLDGRRLEVSVGEPFSYRDRWDNIVERRLTESLNMTNALRRSTSPPAARRFRIPSANAHVEVGVPVLQRVSGRKVSAGWYESSPAYLGSRPLYGAGLESYRSLLCLASAEDPQTPAGGDETPPDDADALWKFFLERHVLRAPSENDDETPSATRRRAQGAILQLLRTIAVDGGDRYVRERFRREPSPALARDLLARGLDDGVEHYRETIDELEPIARLQAAQFLIEAGESTGVTAVLQLTRAEPTPVRGTLVARTVAALDRYLESAEPLPGERREILDYIVSQLGRNRTSSYVLREIFSSLERESGKDFGYSSARTLNDRSERQRAVEAAIAAATSWWKEHAGN